MCSAYNSYSIILTGEMYSHRYVRAELDAIDNRPWRTTSDTETILRAWEHWQTDALQKLGGMFALALWDSVEERLFLARDRAGKKPLFFYSGPNVFLFGSEIKSLLTHTDAPREMDEDRIAEWVTYWFLPCNVILFKYIHPLPMGTWLLISSSSGSTEPRPFWTSSKVCTSTVVDESEAIDAFEEWL